MVRQSLCVLGGPQFASCLYVKIELEVALWCATVWQYDVNVRFVGKADLTTVKTVSIALHG